MTEKQKKIALLLKGGSLAALTIAGFILAMAASGNPVVVTYAAAGFVGWLMVGNTILEAIELFTVNPSTNQKAFGAYKMFTLVTSAIAAAILLLPLVADAFTAFVLAAVVVFFCAIANGVEARYL